MAKTFRLAILMCDTPIDPIKERYGTYGNIFSNLLKKQVSTSFPTSNLVLETSEWDVVDAQKYPDLSSIDGILMTGSKHDSFEHTPWILKLVEYTQKAFEAKKAIIGICFGHQILARAMGASVGRSDKGWEVSADHIDLTEAGQSLFRKSSLVLSPQGLTLHQMHRDVAFAVPSGFQNLGTSPRCDVQGLYLPGRALSVQAHPEFDDFIMDHILKKRHGDGIFSDDMYEDGDLRRKLEHDGMVVAEAILRLLFGIEERT